MMMVLSVISSLVNRMNGKYFPLHQNLVILQLESEFVTNRHGSVTNGRMHERTDSVQEKAATDSAVQLLSGTAMSPYLAQKYPQ